MSRVSHVREILPRAKAADRSGHFEVPFEWTPSKRFDHGQACEYRLPLGDHGVAILRLVAGKGWALSITQGAGGDTARGLFATPHDGLMVLFAEFAAGDIAPPRLDGDSPQ